MSAPKYDILQITKARIDPKTIPRLAIATATPRSLSLNQLLAIVVTDESSNGTEEERIIEPTKIGQKA
jgi:hypothetical protein